MPIFSSVQSLSCVRLFATPWITAHQVSLSPTPGVRSNSCPLNRWCHPAISSCVVLFSSCPQSRPASGSFTLSQLFSWGGQSIGVSALASVLPMNIQDWFTLGWTGWISLQSKRLSRVFSNTTVQKHQFFSTQLSLYAIGEILFIGILIYCHPTFHVFFFGCEACGILALWPGIKPMPPYIVKQSLNHWTAREVPTFQKFI